MIALAVVFTVFGALGVLLLLLNAVLGPKRTNPVKERPFECGSPPLQEDIGPVPVKFSLIAFLFLLFDVEAVFLFPWALIMKANARAALPALLAFVAVLGAAFAYAWKKGAFEGE